jgi:hypothetical protein
MKMLSSLILAINTFSMVVLLSSRITHPLIVGFVQVVLSMLHFGLIVGLRYFPRHFPSSVLNEWFWSILYMSYPTFKTHFKNGDSYQVMTQAIGQEPLLTTLHPLPTGSRIMGGQEKSQHHKGLGT